MKEIQQKAANHFDNDYNCAQAVLAAYAQEFGHNEKELARIAAGFGGGMGRLQQTCGAVSGAYMVIGLKGGSADIDDKESKEHTYNLVRRFAARFKELMGSTECKSLLMVDLMTDEGQKKFTADGLKDKVCHKCVSVAIQVLHEIFEDK